MYEINSNNYFNNDKSKFGLKNDNNPFNSFQKDNLNTAHTTFNNTSQSNNLYNFERYKNQQLLNQTRKPFTSVKCNCNCHISTDLSPRCNCHHHHFHIHHIHIPQSHLSAILNKENLSEMTNSNNTLVNSNNLLKEVTELRNECRKFKEELDRNNKEKNAEDNYRRELEKGINSQKNTENNDDNNSNLNKYHDMLDKSFEVLNSVSNKCNEEKAKIKGGVYYYMNKKPDYNQLIQAQKNWIDNLPENYELPKKFNNSTSRTYSINDDNIQNPNRINFNDKNNILNRNLAQINYPSNFIKGRQNLNNQNDNNNRNKYYFDSKKNNNKGYIIKRGDKINRNNENLDYNDNKEIDLLNEQNKYNENNINNYNDYNEQLGLNQINDLNDNINLNIQNNDNNNDNENEEKENTNNLNSGLINDLQKNKENKFNNNNNLLKKNENNDNNNILKNNENNDNNNILKNNDDNDNNENNKDQEEINPMNERYLILDEEGNPIVLNGQKLLGMELIPLIGEDGKEAIDENGNIILIGPDGQPKSQEELEPILLDNDKPLVNEENKPFLGLLGVPLINGEGNPIIGPGELYDNENKIVEGILGIVAKDKDGNPIKVEINDINDTNSIEDNNDNNNKIKENEIINNMNNLNHENDNENDNDNENNGLKNLGNININENGNGDNSKNNINNYNNNYSNLRPLIGPDGIPLRDSNNNHILLDEKNIPVKNTGISVMLDQSGKPLLNSLGIPILIDIEGKPINIDENNPPREISLNKQFLNKNNFIPPKMMIKNDGFSINKNNLKNERNNRKEKINYSDCNPESLKKINFMRPYMDPFYDDSEYKVNCFACNLGCGVSKSGYSPMNFSPYNNLIRRRDITPLKENYRKKKKKSIKTNIKKINTENDNNYYLTNN